MSHICEPSFIKYWPEKWTLAKFIPRTPREWHPVLIKVKPTRPHASCLRPMGASIPPYVLPAYVPPAYDQAHPVLLEQSDLLTKVKTQLGVGGTPL